MASVRDTADQAAAHRRRAGEVALAKLRTPDGLLPNAKAVRAIARAAGVEAGIDRVSSSRRATYLWLARPDGQTVAQRSEMRAGLANAMRWQWCDSTRRVHVHETMIAVHREGYGGVPVLPAMPPELAERVLSVGAWAALVDAVRRQAGAMYLADILDIVELQRHQLVEMPEPLNELDGPATTHAVATTPARVLVEAALRATGGSA